MTRVERLRLRLAQWLAPEGCQVQTEWDRSAAWECLDMVRERLEHLGLAMKHTPPMFYDDAIAALASILGRAAGLTTGWDVTWTVVEHQANLTEQAMGRGPQEPPR